MSTTVESTTSPTTFEVRSPGTGDLLGTYPNHTVQDVHAAVERARPAGQWWAGLGFHERRRRLDAFRGILGRRHAQLAGIMHEETGKPTSEAVLEILGALDHVAWAARNAQKVLGRSSVRSSLMSAHLAGTVEYRPFGVVGVIGPWNFPVLTPLGSIAFALAAGNAVVFKPSEFTPGVGAWLVDAFTQVVPEQPVLQLVTGLGETGAALTRADVDKIAFTGSTATAKRVMAACAESLTPLVAECGGKDAFVVDEDADLDAAADGAVWSGMFNAGQVCVGTERVFVHERVHDEFVAKVAAKVNGLRAGDSPRGKVGPITMPSQVGLITDQVADALGRGARVLAGEQRVDGQVVQPIVLTDVPDDAPVMREETFGPLLTVRKVRDMDEAIELVNATEYGLAGTVYAKARAREIASRFRSGMVSVNSVLSFALHSGMPFGGVGGSGFGRIHGPDGLREFCYAQSVVRQRFPLPVALTSFTRTESTDGLLAQFITLVHGRH